MKIIITAFVIFMSCVASVDAFAGNKAEMPTPHLTAKASIHQHKNVQRLGTDEKNQFDHYYAKAITLFYDGHFRSALSVLKQLQSTIDDLNVTYYAALCNYKLGFQADARNDLKRILASDPGHYRARMVLADLYMDGGDLSAAKKQVHYLEDALEEEEQQVLLSRLISLLDDERSQHSYYLSLKQEIRWNSNINAGCEKSEIISANGTAYRLDESDQALSDWGSITHLYGWHRFDPDSLSSLFWDTTTSLYHTHYFEQDEFDFSIVRLKSGPIWKKRRYHISLPGGYRAGLDTGGLDSQELFLNPELKIQMNKRLALKGSFYYGDRSYSDPEDEELDKLRRRIELKPILYLDSTMLCAALAAFDTSAEAPRFSYHGTEASIFARHRFNRTISMFMRYKYRIRRYEGAYSGWSDKRKDVKNSIHAWLNFKINNNILFGPSVSWTINDSNTELYEYERYTAGLNLTLKFY